MNKFYFSLYFIFILNFINCFSTLKAPPITFTQSQTAAEKQMVGEDKELEKDGWLISSIKTSSHGSDEWQKDTLIYNQSEFKDKDYYTLLSTIAYLAPEVKTYKSKALLGEGLSGLLEKPKVILDKTVLEEYSIPSNKKRLEEVTRLINDARVRIYETRILAANKTDTKETDLNKIREKIILSNYNNSESGEFIEVTKGVWAKK